MATNPPKRQAPKPNSLVMQWLLDSDPSLRWQALQDLIGAPAEEVATERRRVAWDWDGTWRGWDSEGTPFFVGEVEPCINGQVEASGASSGGGRPVRSSTPPGLGVKLGVKIDTTANLSVMECELAPINPE